MCLYIRSLEKSYVLRDFSLIFSLQPPMSLQLVNPIGKFDICWQLHEIGLWPLRTGSRNEGCLQGAGLKFFLRRITPRLEVWWVKKPSYLLVLTSWHTSSYLIPSGMLCSTLTLWVTISISKAWNMNLREVEGLFLSLQVGKNMCTKSTISVCWVPGPVLS